MLVDYARLSKEMAGTSVLRPLSSTLSGHAAGELFDKHVYALIKSQHPGKTFRQYEYLNDLYSRNPLVIGHKARLELFNSPTIMFLLSRGKGATDKWHADNPFDEKQNDTADILVVDNSHYEVIDIKTRNISKSAQPPNIISAYKLARFCALMLDNKDFTNFGIPYFEVDWVLQDGRLVCKETHHASLFKILPSELYINWAAAMQIQFHVADVAQSYSGNAEQWAKDYLKHFVAKAKKRAKDMIGLFVTPFEKYLK